MTLFHIYRALTWVITPFLTLYLYGRLSQGKEHATRFLERLGQPSLPRPEGQVLWLHCASVGETLSAVPLLRQLETSLPQAHFLLTTGTTTAAKVVEPYLGPRTLHQFIPLDTPGAVKKFFNHWHPQVALWFESELWPNLLFTLATEHIPAFLLNARLSPRSYTRWKRLGPWLIKPLLEVFQVIYAQSEAVAEQLRSLGACKVKALGNLKMASAPLPYDPEAFVALDKKLKGRPFWVAASTHPGEEELILQVHKRLKAAFPRLLTLLVPRHPHRGEALLKGVREAGLVGALRTETPHMGGQEEVYIADTLGELGLFYRLAPVVFVGGSLVDIGGHNLIEPAHHHCAILQGPWTYNFSEITSQFQEGQGVRVVNDVEDLCDQVQQLLADPLKAQAQAEAAFQLTLKGTQLVQKVVEDIQGALDRHVSKP